MIRLPVVSQILYKMVNIIGYNLITFQFFQIQKLGIQNIKKFGIKTVETDILNMHGFYSDDDDGISEKQKLVVATDSMPKKDWQKTRAFSWMTAFLHFNKILQIPIIIYHHLTGQDYKTIINFFVNEESEEFKLISKIRKYFLIRP